jgi:hypothetical protein
MKKLLLTMTAVSALAVAAPAAAQSAWQNNNYASASANTAIGNRIAQLDQRFQAGVQSGAITRAEAQSLRPQLRELRRLERQYSLNGLTQFERQDLQQRLRNVRQQVRIADNNFGDRYTNWQDDTYSGQGGPYGEVGEVCGTRSGISGVIGSILGGGDNCLSVGERVSGSGLSGLPYQYRDQFRDGPGYYYRYANGKVIQVDARSQTVTRIYDVD